MRDFARFIGSAIVRAALCGPLAGCGHMPVTSMVKLAAWMRGVLRGRDLAAQMPACR
jgi:hypothetical protein